MYITNNSLWLSAFVDKAIKKERKKKKRRKPQLIKMPPLLYDSERNVCCLANDDINNLCWVG